MHDIPIKLALYPVALSNKEPRNQEHNGNQRKSMGVSRVAAFITDPGGNIHNWLVAPAEKGMCPVGEYFIYGIVEFTEDFSFGMVLSSWSTLT